MKFAMITLGCKVNGFEAESVAESLQDLGYIQVSSKEIADIYIIFTCAVTNTASSKSRQKINQVIKLNKDAVICVVGCYVQVESAKLAENKDIDLIIGSKHKDQIPQLIQEEIQKKKRINLVEDVLNQPRFENMQIKKFKSQTRAYMKIQDGCNQYCSYCIIPYARGNERCLNSDQVIANAKNLAQNHQEIVLTGIHTGRYQDQDLDLCGLIKKILKEVPQLTRIRISSIEVTEITDELIELMSQETRIAPHLHIPLQSGSDATLKRMNRPYTTLEFKAKVAKIRKYLPNISISTDLIVGFIGETEQEYQDTLAFIKEIKFSFMHVFPFSLKTGTKACELGQQVNGSVVKKRAHECGLLSVKLYDEYKERFINQTVSVIIETMKGQYAFGHSAEYLPVMIEQDLSSNNLVQVKITHKIADALYGEVIK